MSIPPHTSVLTPPANQLSTSVFSSSYASPSPMTTAKTGETKQVILFCLGSYIQFTLIVTSIRAGHNHWRSCGRGSSSSDPGIGSGWYLNASSLEEVQ